MIDEINENTGAEAEAEATAEFTPDIPQRTEPTPQKALPLALAVCGGMTVVCTVLRLLQLSSVIDYETGFFHTYSGSLSWILYAFLGAAGAAFVLLSVLDRRRKCFFYTKRMGQIDGTETLLCGVMYLLAAVFVLIDLAGQIGGGAGIHVVLSCCVGAGGYLLAGASLVKNKRITASAGFSFLMLGFYYTMMSVVNFMSHNVITQISDYLLRLLTDICLVLFFLFAGRIFSRNETKTTRIRVSVFGLGALLLILTETLSKLIYWITISEAQRGYLSQPDVVFLMPDAQFVAKGIAVLVTMIVLVKLPYKKNAT